MLLSPSPPLLLKMDGKKSEQANSKSNFASPTSGNKSSTTGIMALGWNAKEWCDDGDGEGDDDDDDVDNNRDNDSDNDGDDDRDAEEM